MKARQCNPPSLRFNLAAMEDGKWQMASLECGDTSPLSPAMGVRVTPCAPLQEHKKTARRGLTRPTCLALLLCFCFLLSVFSFRASGQSYSIDWYKVSGGGGTSTGEPMIGTNYSVSGTLGQHDAGGPMTGGNYSLTGGFWALISVVQTPGAPTLYITRSGNTVTVYWQAVSGWSLQQNANLALANGWSTSGGVTPANGTNYLNLTSPAGNLFFRLSNP